MARREIYNTIDCKERLLLIGIRKDKYGGYKQDLLEKDLGETEIDFYVCVKCIGLMRNACLVNEPKQILVCEVCKIGEDSIPMVKARKNISRLRSKCPLMKRGCVWKGSLGEIDAHLDECAEFILNCYNVCGVLLKRSELQNHCENECQLRIVKCEYCGATIQHKLLDNHNKICPEFPLVCPNECLTSLIRKELKSHIEKECPNTLIACPYKEMGCDVVTKRSELPKHEKTNESNHLDKTKVFYFNKVKKMESIMQAKEDEIKQLTAKVRNMEKECQRSKISKSPVLALTMPSSEVDELTEREKWQKSLQLDSHDLLSLEVHNHETKDAAAEGQKRQKQFDYYKDNRTKSMCVIGLHNLGNTGYFNSALQNLLYLRPFRDQLIHTMTRTEYKFVPEKHPELDPITFVYINKPEKLTGELFKLMKETAYQPEATEGSHSKKFSKKVITPRGVQNEIARKHRKFSNGSQQDSHELLRILIDMVKDEEIKRLKAAFLAHFGIKDYKTEFKTYPEDKKKLLRKYASEFKNVFVFFRTFIDDTFGGKMISTVECLDCGNISDTNEHFLDISLLLLKDSKRGKVHSQPPTSKQHKQLSKADKMNLKEKSSKNTGREIEKIELKNLYSPEPRHDSRGGEEGTGGKEESISKVNESHCEIDQFVHNHPLQQSQSEVELNSEKGMKIKLEEVKRLRRSDVYSECSLEYCLMRFFSPEFLEKDYVCAQCNRHLIEEQDNALDFDFEGDNDEKESNTESIDLNSLHFSNANEQFHIKTVGPVLTIHLKRVSETGYGLQKVNKHIDFPLVLDMSPFCVSNTPACRDYNNQILYGLRGIVVHSGGLSGGYYVAYVNIADWKSSTTEENSEDITSIEQPMDIDPAQETDDNRMLTSENCACEPQSQPTPTPDSHLYEHVTPTEEWYYISDSHVSRTDHNHVFSSQAYMLFYERLPLVAKDTHVLQNFKLLF